jgi:hypothetical protein
MIVNHLENKKGSESEIDFETAKTIDTGTGVYLRYIGGNSQDLACDFKIYDQDTIVRVNTTRNVKKTKDAPLQRDCEYRITYTLDQGIFFSGTPKRKHYADLIKNLLAVYCDAYGDWGGQKGKFVVEVNYTARSLQALNDWEAGIKGIKGDVTL